MRRLAGFVDEVRPDAFAVCEIDSGDAFALATRFALQWSYRGRQALYCTGAFVMRAVHDVYLPVRPAHPLDRRGLLRVDAAWQNRACTLATTQIAADRESRIRELRFARSQLRAATHDAIAFVHLEQRAIAFSDLGFGDVTPEGGDERIYVRGFDEAGIAPVVARV
jgi:hypothetical protein